MPQLKCTVQTCVHNKQMLCNLDTIQVGGGHARTASETCCDSFQERQTGPAMGRTTNAAIDSIAENDASPLTNIDCKAVECMYNDQCRCHAGRISVEGAQATEAQGTECATFECPRS